jgi:hypothetical protein
MSGSGRDPTGVSFAPYSLRTGLSYAPQISSSQVNFPMNYDAQTEYLCSGSSRISLPRFYFLNIYTPDNEYLVLRYLDLSPRPALPRRVVVSGRPKGLHSFFAHYLIMRSRFLQVLTTDRAHKDDLISSPLVVQILSVEVGPDVKGT